MKAHYENAYCVYLPLVNEMGEPLTAAEITKAIPITVDLSKVVLGEAPIGLAVVDETWLVLSYLSIIPAMQLTKICQSQHGLSAAAMQKLYEDTQKPDRNADFDIPF